MPDNEAMVTTVDRYIELMSAGDREGWLDLFADGATIEDPVGTPLHEGREAIGAFWDLARSLADTVRLERTGPVRCAGGEAAFPMLVHSEIGENRVVVDVIDVFRMVEGPDGTARIAAMRAFWDPRDMRPET
jgi:steroid Delta-isomerase